MLGLQRSRSVSISQDFFFPSPISYFYLPSPTMRTPNPKGINLFIHFPNSVVHTKLFWNCHTDTTTYFKVTKHNSRFLSCVFLFVCLVFVLVRRYPLESYSQILSSKLSWIVFFPLLCIVLSIWLLLSWCIVIHLGSLISV